MRNESLRKALGAIIVTLDKLDIDVVDKVELMLNLKSFLSEISYRHNIEVLEMEQSRFKEVSYETDQSVQLSNGK